MKQTARNIIERAVDLRHGLIHEVIDLCMDPCDPDMYFCAAQMPDMAPLVGIHGNDRSSGAGLSREEAVMGAIGEAVERYACAFYDEKSLIYASFDQLHQEAVLPESFAMFSTAQYEQDPELPRFTRDLGLRWARAHSLCYHRDVLVPAQFVYMPYRYGGEPMLAMTTSSGLACGSSFAEAALSGLLELVERDAVMTFWLNQVTGSRLIVDPASRFYRDYSQRLQRSGVAYHLFDFTTDLGIPCVFAVAQGMAEPRVSAAVGAAARLSSAAAARKAVLESVQTRTWLRQMVHTLGPFPISEGFGNVIQFEDHVRLFGHTPMLPALDFLLKEAQTSMLSCMPELSTGLAEADLERAVAMVKAVGLDVLAIDLTTPDVADLGFTVVRVLVPGLVQLTTNHNQRMLGGQRLYETPLRLGLLNRPKAESDLNPVPHPFP